MREISLFALEGSREFGGRVADHLGLALADHEERVFEDGEHKARPLTSVRGRDVFVIHSLYGDAEQSGNDKLCKLLFFIGALRDASAARVTAVVPYLAYARKDRKTQSRDPVTTRYVAALFEAVGVELVSGAARSAPHCASVQPPARPASRQAACMAYFIAATPGSICAATAAVRSHRGRCPTAPTRRRRRGCCRD